MNMSDMKNVMGMMENMQGKSPMDILASRNPQFRDLQNANPMDMLSKMGMGGLAGGNADFASVLNMASKMKTGQNRGRQKMYYGLAPIASFAPPEIIYELNRYLSSF